MDEQRDQYFAALPVEEIGAEILDRVEKYYQHVRKTGRLLLWRRSFNTYYKELAIGTEIQSSGEEGEFANISINHYQNLLKHLLTLTTNERPAWEPISINTDHRSQAQTILAKGLLDYYMKEKNFDAHVKQGVEQSLIFGEGFVLEEWDTELGKPYGVSQEEDGSEKVIKEGDIHVQNLTPLDCIRDFSKESPFGHKWQIVRTVKNRWDLIAQYPEYEDAIKGLPDKSESFNEFNLTLMDEQESDDVVVWTLYHLPSAALPEGRMVQILDDEITLLDNAHPYQTLPAKRISASDVIGHIWGHSVGFSLLVIQEALDALHSTVLTNQTTFGVQNIIIPKGHDISISSLTGGLNLIEYSGKDGRPEAINFTSTPAEIFKYIDQLEREMETISGINSVARGNPDKNLQSGSALALVQSMAIQFSSGLQQSYVKLLENLGSSLIELLQNYATTKRVASIAGKSKQQYLKEFEGSDLDQINRVTVDVGNPLTKTVAGKIQIAEAIIQNFGPKVTPEQMILLYTTGQYENLIEGTTAELMLIQNENEMLKSGEEPVVTMATDAHLTHIKEHKAVLSSTNARMDQEIVERTLAHIQEHITMLQSVDPNLLGAIGEQPIAPAAPTNVAPMNLAANELGPDNPIAAAQGVSMPNMPKGPKNLLTGENVELPPGGPVQG